MSTEELDEVALCLKSVRDLVNDPILNPVLASGDQRFFDLCAAMDASEDAQLGIEAFPPAIPEGQKGLGTLYLATYGLLNAFYVQTSMLQKIARFVGLGIERPDKLKSVIKIRNLAAAHPANDLKVAAFLTRNNLTVEGFSLRKERYDQHAESGLRGETVHVVIADLLEDQATGVKDLVSQITAHLEHRALELRAQWQQGGPEEIATKLRLVVDHAAELRPDTEAATARSVASDLRECAQATRELAGECMSSTQHRSMKDTLIDVQRRASNIESAFEHPDADHHRKAAVDAFAEAADWLLELFTILDLEHRTAAGESNGLGY